jgi:hypothetical protein
MSHSLERTWNLRPARAAAAVLIVLAALLAGGVWLFTRLAPQPAPPPPPNPAGIRGTPINALPTQPPAAVNDGSAAPASAPASASSQTARTGRPPPVGPGSVSTWTTPSVDPEKAGLVYEPELPPDGTYEGEYRPVGFRFLSKFDYDPFLIMDATPEEYAKLPQQIPEDVRALNGRKVQIGGFMVPVEFAKDNIRTFLLVKNRMMCCFGAAVSMNDWVYVTMKEDRKAEFHQDVLVKVSGVLEVGEKIEDGMVMSIYRLTGDSIEYLSGF